MASLLGTAVARAQSRESGPALVVDAQTAEEWRELLRRIGVRGERDVVELDEPTQRFAYRGHVGMVVSDRADDEAPRAFGAKSHGERVEKVGDAALVGRLVFVVV